MLETNNFLKNALLKLLCFLPLMGTLRKGIEEESNVYDERSIYRFEVRDMNKNEYKLDKYRGDVIIIVNVASKCKLANKSYKELSELLKRHSDKGLRILLFPCSQFLDQEYEELAEIKAFADKYNEEFILMDKVEVKGNNIHPLFEFLVEELPGTFGNYIKWNFTYFLIDRNGIPVRRYSPTGSITPKDKYLLKVLNESPANEPANNYAL